VPLVSTEDFPKFVSKWALSPHVTCEQLKTTFGVPELTTVRDPAEIGLPFEEACAPTAAGERLRVWYIPAQPDRGTVLLAYGAIGELPCYLLIAKNLVAAGWSVVMYDYQGFGGSTGKPSLSSLLVDHDAALDWALTRTGRPHVTLMGVSIGTLPSVAQAARRPEAVNALVLDGVLSLRAQLEQFWFLIGGRTREYLDLFDPALRLEEQITHAWQPIQAFVYGRDEWTSSKKVRSVLARAATQPQIHEFPALAHARGPYLSTQTYFAELDAFLTQVWSADANMTPPVSPAR
jgi:pimeloyl-ACP methyl ester carboxylesterase